MINVDDNFEHFDIFNGFLKYGVFLPLYHFWINSTLSYTYKLQNGLFTFEMVYLHWKKKNARGMLLFQSLPWQHIGIIFKFGLC